MKKIITLAGICLSFACGQQYVTKDINSYNSNTEPHAANHELYAVKDSNILRTSDFMDDSIDDIHETVFGEFFLNNYGINWSIEKDERKEPIFGLGIFVDF